MGRRMYCLGVLVLVFVLAGYTTAGIASGSNKYAILVRGDSIPEWTNSLKLIEDFLIARGFPRDNIETVMEETADKTKSGLIAAFDTISKAMLSSSDPEFVFYYVGHGNNSGIALGSDENANTMYWLGETETLITAAGTNTNTLAGNLLRIPSKKMTVIIDACHSGNALDDLNGIGLSGRILTATDNTSDSLAPALSQTTLYTGLLAEGARRSAACVKGASTGDYLEVGHSYAAGMLKSYWTLYLTDPLKYLPLLKECGKEPKPQLLRLTGQYLDNNGKSVKVAIKRLVIDYETKEPIVGAVVELIANPIPPGQAVTTTLTTNKEGLFEAKFPFYGFFTYKISFKKGCYEVFTKTEGLTGGGPRSVFELTNVDEVPPKIALLGRENITLEYGDQYTEPGAEVTDNCCAGELVIGGDTVDTTKPGTYIVTYDAKDSRGNTAEQIKRHVEVRDPIRLLEFRFSPTSIVLLPDHHSTVTVTAKAMDRRNDLESITVSFSQEVVVSLLKEPRSESDHESTWVGFFKTSDFRMAGAVSVNRVSLASPLGSHSLDFFELRRQGFPVNLQVGDGVPPKLVELDREVRRSDGKSLLYTGSGTEAAAVARGVIDTSVGRDTLKLIVKGKDPVGGLIPSVSAVALKLRSPSGKLTDVRSIEEPYTFSFTHRFSESSEAGIWHIHEIQLTDKAGNQVSYSTADLQARSFITAFKVFVTKDETPPNLKGFDFHPRQVNTSEGPVAVTVSVNATDDQTGVSDVRVEFIGFTGSGETLSVRYLKPSLTWKGGNTWQGTLTVPKCSEVKTWELSMISVFDAAFSPGNNFFYSRLRPLASKGFPTLLKVVNHPVIALNGPQEVTVECQEDTFFVPSPYRELGAQVLSCCPDVVKVVIGGDKVDASKSGTYVVTYDAEDCNGNTADQVTRTVHVVEPGAPGGGPGAPGGDRVSGGPGWCSEYHDKVEEIEVLHGLFFDTAHAADALTSPIAYAPAAATYDRATNILYEMHSLAVDIATVFGIDTLTRNRLEKVAQLYSEAAGLWVPYLGLVAASCEAFARGDIELGQQLSREAMPIRLQAQNRLPQALELLEDTKPLVCAPCWDFEAPKDELSMFREKAHKAMQQGDALRRAGDYPGARPEYARCLHYVHQMHSVYSEMLSEFALTDGLKSLLEQGASAFTEVVALYESILDLRERIWKAQEAGDAAAAESLHSQLVQQRDQLLNIERRACGIVDEIEETLCN